MLLCLLLILNLTDDPLREAIDHVKGDEVRRLIQAGHDPNRLADGSSTLSHALGWSHEGIMAELIKAGADPNRKTLSTYLEETQELFGRMTCSVGETPQRYLIPLILGGLKLEWDQFQDLAFMERWDLESWFLEIQAMDASQMMLIKALYFQDIPLLKDALTDAALNQPDFLLVPGEKNTPLAYALKQHNWEAVRLLLDAGADPLFTDAQATSALVLLCRSRKPPMDLVARLASMRSEHQIKMQQGLRVAIIYGLEDVIRVLMKGVELRQDILNEAANSVCSIDLIKDLIAAGAELNYRDKDGHTPMDYAVSSKNTGLINLLKTHGVAVP